MHIEKCFRTDRLLKDLSTFGIGGPIRYYFSATHDEEILEAVQWAVGKKIPWFFLGCGSNCLFDDRGYDGLVIHNQVEYCEWSERSVFVSAGYRFSLLGIRAAKMGLSGLEFAIGIPGSVGGAIYMNAGANGCETSQVLQEVIYMDSSGEKKRFLPNDLAFGRRQSSFQAMPGWIAAARFELEKKENVRERQLEYLRYRIATQPHYEKSAGCIFCNPPEGAAGALIDRCGLKGRRRGGAKVSEKHANFIINDQGASQADVLLLIAEIRQTVYEQTNIWLEPEVRVVPFVSYPHF
jgi:UDP-N-acetylmuramate dehydrogenase